MKRLSLTLIAVGMLAITACKQPDEQPAAYNEQPYQPLTQLDTAPPPAAYEPQPYAADPYATDPMVTPRGSAADEVIVAGDSGVRTHVVRKGDTLYQLARLYYNDHRQWRKIWEANRGLLPSPDKISIGTELAIP